MSDAVWLTKQGVPTVVVVHTIFEAAARNYIRLNRTDIPLIIMPRPQFDWTAEYKQSLLDEWVPQIIDGWKGQTA